MNTAADTSPSAPVTPQYELMRTVARAGGGSSSSRSTFEGSAKAARKAQISELRRLNQPHALDCNSVIFDEPNGDQVRLEWIQK